MSEVSVLEKNTLISALKKIDEISESVWTSKLNDRKKKELEFHDQHRDRGRVEQLDQDTYEKFYANRRYYVATENSKRYVDEWIAANAKDKVFLDYACGNGFNAIKAAKAGAVLAVGIDISPTSVKNARNDAEIAQVQGNTFFVQADAEDTLLPSGSIDIIICSGMLHHLDLSCAFPELRRILKPGGKILAVEALDYNPAIKAYRQRTPEMRTEWEKAHILSLKDVEFAKRFFSVGEIKYWHITSILSAHFTGLRKFFDAIDSFLTRVPGIRLMSWIFTFELIKDSK